MATIIRYFSTTGAGAADGTTWADRAAFLSGGAINTIISAFDFTSDSLIARVGPGSYALTTQIATFTGTSTPSASKPCIFEAADSSGNAWQSPDPAWQSAQPAWSDTDMPVISTSTNINTISNGNVGIRGFKLTSSARNSGMLSDVYSISWCIIEQNQSNASSSCVGSVVVKMDNVVCKATGTSFNYVLSCGTGSDIYNVRIEGNASASSGSRYGMQTSSGATLKFVKCTVFGCVGGPIVCAGAGGAFIARNLTIIGTGVSVPGIYLTRTTGGQCVITQSVIVNNGTYGINNSGSGELLLNRNRYRDNSTADVNNAGSNPELDAYTTDTDDATEFADSASGDYRIANTAATWGKGYGAGDEPAAGGSGSARPSHPLLTPQVIG